VRKHKPVKNGPFVLHSRFFKAKIKGRDKNDWLLHRELFDAVHDQWKRTGRKPFNVDCAANPKGTNAQLPSFYSKEDDFLLSRGEKGNILYMNPPFPQIEKFVHQFLKLSNKDVSTACCLITPYTPDRKWWRLVQDNFVCVKRIDRRWKGTDGGYTFSRPASADQYGVRESPGPPPFDVCVWFSKPRKVEVFSTSFTWEDKMRSLDIGDLMVFRGKLQGESGSVLVDGGAQVCLLNQKLADKLQLKGDDCEVNLNWFDGSSSTVRKVVRDVKLLLNGKPITVKEALLVDLSTFDVILGSTWLNNNAAVLEHHPNPAKRKLWIDGDTFVVPCDHMPRVSTTPLVSLCTAEQGARILRQNPSCEIFYGTLKVADVDAQSGKVELSHTIGASGPQWFKDKALQLVQKYAKVFEPPSGPLPNVEPAEIHVIPGAEPYAVPPYRLSDQDQKELDALLTEMIRKGWIRPSRSSWSSPVLVLRKPNGKIRLVIDFRVLNSKTVSDKFPLPRIDTILSQLKNAKVFSKMDCFDGFHQIGLHENSKSCTAFVTGGPQGGLWEWNMLPQGLKVSPSIFARTIQHLFRDSIASGNWLKIYLDDLLIHTVDYETHLEKMEEVFQTLLRENLRISPAKSIFGVDEISYLGHSISSKGIRPCSSKVKSIVEWEKPENHDQLHKFYGLCSWFRKLMPKFTESAYGISERLRSKDWEWSDVEQKSFDACKQLVCELTYTTPFEEHLDTCIWVDASEYGIGGALLQKRFCEVTQREEWLPVAFESRKLSAAECRYNTTEREQLAVVHSLRVWSHWLKGIKPFKVYTDHSALLTKPTTLVKQARRVRWFETMGEFDFIQEHKPGISNVLADALSRRPDYFAWFQHYKKDTYGPTMVSKPVQSDPVQILSVVADQSKHSGKRVAWHKEKETKYYFEAVMPADLITKYFNAKSLTVSKSVLHKSDNVFISSVLVSTVWVSRIPLAFHQDLQAACAEYVIPKNSCLHRDGEGFIRTPANQLYIPTVELQVRLVEHVHQLCFHSGIRKTKIRLKSYCWWKHMHKTVAEVLKGCETCQAVKSVKKKLQERKAVSVDVPDKFTHLQVDFVWGLPYAGPQRYTGLMCLTDVFSKLCRVVAVQKHVDSAQAARIILTEWVSHYGPPSVIQSDQDVRFVSDTYSELLQLIGTKVQLSTPYRPQSQGQVERLNQTVVQCLRAWVYDVGAQRKWHEALPWLNFVLNSSVHDTTGVSPHMCAFGVELRTLPCSEFASSAGVSTEQAETLRSMISDKLKHQELEMQEDNRPATPVWAPVVGEHVWLDSRNLKWKKTAKAKLVPKFVGPFEVESVVDSGKACKLKMPAFYTCKRTWSCDYLKPFNASTLGLAPSAKDWGVELAEMLDDVQELDPEQPQPVPTSESVYRVVKCFKRKNGRFVVWFEGSPPGEIPADYSYRSLIALPGGQEAFNQWLSWNSKLVDSSSHEAVQPTETVVDLHLDSFDD